MSEGPLHYQTISQVADRIAAKDLSPVKLTTAILDRIEQLDGQLKSYATLMADQAMVSARLAEDEITAGNYRGPLHGVPIAVKDLCFTKGVRTMGGSKALADHVPEFDGTVVARFKEAGAILLGKLNLTEGAMGGYNPALDIPKNPWNPDRWAGASSSGSGAATAAGLCYGSLGSDTGGSIRFPSAACGIVGIKPTWGRVSRYGVLALADSLDHVGPMTRSTADAAIILRTIAGHDPNDPTSLPSPVPDYLDRIEQGIKDTRIGWAEDYATRDIDPEVVEAVRAGVRVLEDLGAEIVEIDLPDLDPYVTAWPELCSTEAIVAHEATYPSQAGDYGPWFRGWLEMGAQVSGADYARANNQRAACIGHLRSAFENIDLLACPTMSFAPYEVTEEGLYGPSPTKSRDPVFQRFTAPFDYSGAPTISLPCGLNSENPPLPLSLQLVGKHLSEPLLCRAGHAFEQATEWNRMRPPID
jgi:amidase